MAHITGRTSAERCKGMSMEQELLKCSLDLCPTNCVGQCSCAYATVESIRTCELRIAWNARQRVIEWMHAIDWTKCTIHGLQAQVGRLIADLDKEQT